MPLFCFYCGFIGHNEKGCSVRRKDVVQDCVKTMQFGYWMRAGNKRKEELGNKELWTGREDKLQDGLTTMPLRANAGEGGDRRLEEGLKAQDWSTSVQDGVLEEGGKGPRTNSGEGEGVDGSGRERLGVRGAMLEQGRQMDNEVTTDHIGGVMLQAVSNNAAREGKQDSSDCGEGRVLQEGILAEASSVPLSDCTNRLSPMLDHPAEKHKLSSKGQWKRRARQLGKGSLIGRGSTSMQVTRRI